ncbi:peptidase S1 and S6 chymotrypsin/Hap [Chthoniobacter flavus Ellin428]|uniref:Serine protease n=1 Tax=Chthoniobacter flavus Ellin428 TaxID=497964 RepID=B4D9H0_9BACT|nr:peptidase S1 and S6 chymotrypsin/Hap [Chthoniobacter flavus Ellin428]
MRHRHPGNWPKSRRKFLYAEYQKRAKDVLAAPAEQLSWLKLPRAKNLSLFTTKAGKKAAAAAQTLSVYEDLPSGRGPASVYPEVEELSNAELGTEIFNRSENIRKTIYGTGDHRIDIYTAEDRRAHAVAEAHDPAPIEGFYIEQAKSVGFILHESMLRELPNGNFYVMPENYGLIKGLCDSELFTKQPCLTQFGVGGIGTAFLVSGQKAMTARHCVPDDTTAKSLRLVFGYALTSSSIPFTISFQKEDVFHIKVANSNNSDDWAVLELDRPTTRPALKFGSGKPDVGTIVYALGYPDALPLKISPQGVVRGAIDASHHFIAAVDAFGGNSGSPVLNSQTHEVEGILVSGNSDFRWIPVDRCSRSVIINNDHAGETICSISVAPKP